MNSIIGLTSAEAARRLQKYGPNTVVRETHLSGVAAYLSRFRSPLIIILVLAAVFSFFLHDTASGVIIITIVFLSVTLDFANTYKSEKAAAALQKQVEVFATVLRDDKPKKVALASIVPGDVVQLDAGSIIPADGEITDSNGLSVDESSLTGESFAVEKKLGDVSYMGSSVIGGGGLMQVTATGFNTEFSHLADALHKTAPTEFDIEIRKFSSLIAKVTFALVVAIFALNMLLGHNTLIDSLLFSVALAVGLTPELLPLIITLNLTKGSLIMAKKGVIVKKLPSIQNFGSMDVLCTDKTGTLTENRITVARHMDFSKSENDDVLKYAFVACNFSTAYENPLDAAILAYRKFDTKHYKKIQEIPYDFERKRESVVVKTPDGKEILVTKGAPDEMLGIVTNYQDGKRIKKINSAALNSLKRSYNELSSDGFRSLAIAMKPLDSKDSARSGKAKFSPKDEAEMTFVGFVAFIDPPKQSASKALESLLANGIEVKIITGDDPLVSTKVARELNLNIKGVLTGDQLSKMNKIQLAHAAENTTIFARVNPVQKLAVIEALRFNRHVVGYMGDGINDAPSLRAADIGISVNNAVDVAKETADIILLHKSLGILDDGVIEGRRIFANTLKYLMMSLSSNFGNMFSMAGASLFLPFLPMTAPQILFNNLLYDASQFAIPVDSVDEELVANPRKMDLASIKKFMWVFGPLSSLFDFITFATLLFVFHAAAPEFQTTWFIESLMTQTLVVYIIRTKRIPFVQSRPSWPLMLSVLVVIAVGLAAIFSVLGQYFGFVALPAPYMIAVSIIVLGYLVVAEIVKQAFYRRVDF